MPTNPENIEQLVAAIKQRGAKKVMIQLPEGLKTSATGIIDGLASAGVSCVASADASYGACDLADAEAKQSGCDMLVHVGHTKFYVDFSTAVPVLYYPWTFDVSIGGIDFSSIKENRIGLITNIQHMHLLAEVADKLKNQGKEAHTAGQVLGCWYVNAEKVEEKVDCFLFIGSGVFHSIGMRTEKPVYGLDLEKMSVEKVDVAKMEKRRWAGIYAAKDAKSFAILVTSKAGQHNLIGDADRIKKMLEERDKKAYILLMDEITDRKLMGVKADAFINTACPRLMDDTWSRPFVNANDVGKIFED